MRKGFVTAFILSMLAVGLITGSVVLIVLNDVGLITIKTKVIEEAPKPVVPEITFNSFLESRVSGYPKDNNKVRNLMSSYLVTGDPELEDKISNKFDTFFEDYKGFVLVTSEKNFNPNDIDLPKDHKTAFRRISTPSGSKMIQLRFYDE